MSDLQRLSDEMAIIDVANRYCWSLDENDWDRLGEVFLPDATTRLGSSATQQGLDEIVERCSSALSPLDDSQHIVSNHQIEVTGDEASHRCYLHAQHVRANDHGGPNFIVGGRYEDRLERTPRGWRIRHRDLIVMWTEGNPRVTRPG